MRSNLLQSTYAVHEIHTHTTYCDAVLWTDFKYAKHAGYTNINLYIKLSSTICHVIYISLVEIIMYIIEPRKSWTHETNFRSNSAVESS